MVRPIRLSAAIIAMIALLASCGGDVSIPPGDGVLKGVEYVSVRNEPQHRHEFENESVRIYDVLLPPGHITLYHSHTQDTLYVAVHGSKLESSSLTGFSLPLALPVPSGMVFWRGHKDSHLVHQITNRGDAAARLIGVELKQEATDWLDKPLSSTGLNYEDTYSKARVYKVELAPGEHTEIGNDGFKGVMVSMNNSTLEIGRESELGASGNTVVLESASWQWFDQQQSLRLDNSGNETFNAVLYELP